MKAILKTVLLGGPKRALVLNFLQEAVDSRITFSGGANGTRINSAGIIVAATTPRIDHDPVTLACAGLLHEPQGTNLLLNAKLDGTNLSTQDVTVTNVAHTLSFYGTGTVTLSGASTAGPLVGSGAYPTRSTLTFTPSAGTLTLTVSGDVKFAQLETGSVAYSFIPTAGAAVTRTVDSVTMTGGNFSSWFNQEQGTFYAEATSKKPSGAATVLVAQISGGNDRHQFSVFTTTAATVVGGVVQAEIGSNTLQTVKAAYGYSTNSFAVCTNGGAVAADNAGSVPGALTYLTIGRFDFGGGESLGGHIKRIVYYPRRLPDSMLQRLTA